MVAKYADGDSIVEELIAERRAEEPAFTARRKREPEQQFDGRRFPRAVGAEEPEDLAAADRDREVA